MKERLVVSISNVVYQSSPHTHSNTHTFNCELGGEVLILPNGEPGFAKTIDACRSCLMLEPRELELLLNLLNVRPKFAHYCLVWTHTGALLLLLRLQQFVLKLLLLCVTIL
jgi:hypothetical protein